MSSKIIWLITAHYEQPFSGLPLSFDLWHHLVALSGTALSPLHFTCNYLLRMMQCLTARRFTLNVLCQLVTHLTRNEVAALKPNQKYLVAMPFRGKEACRTGPVP